MVSRSMRSDERGGSIDACPGSSYYGPDRSRYLHRKMNDTQVLERIHYVGGVEFVYNGHVAPETLPTDQPEYETARRPVAGIALELVYPAGINEIRYQHVDHLGSIVAYTSALGEVVARMSFDPWGARREHPSADSIWNQWDTSPHAWPDWANIMLEITPRGYTGHEHLDQFGLIHMNGRIYDPRLGRFLQADPFMEDTGTLNRYTYVHNNPLVYTDPSGYFGISDGIKLVVVIALNYATMGAASPAGWSWVGVGWAAAGGAVSGALMSGTAEGALWGAFSAVAFFGVGRIVNGWGEWAQGDYFGLSTEAIVAKSVSHGLTGGTIAHLQGGKFGHGFLGSGLSAFTHPAIEGSSVLQDNALAQIATAAIVGGSISQITGGKFANGAVTAAMAYAFNQRVSSGHQESEGLPNPTADTEALAESPEFAALKTMVDRVNALIVDGSVGASWLDKVTIDEIRLVENIPDERGEQVLGRTTTREDIFGRRRSSIKIQLGAFESPREALKTLGWELKRTDPVNSSLPYWSGRADARSYSEDVIRQYQKRWDFE